jgi:hypothetical protein
MTHPEGARVDADIARVTAGILANRARGFGAYLESIAAHLRPGMDASRALDIYLTHVLPEVYRSLVLERGWTLAQYETWLGDQLVHQLLRCRSTPAAQFWHRCSRPGHSTSGPAWPAGIATCPPLAPRFASSAMRRTGPVRSSVLHRSPAPSARWCQLLRTTEEPQFPMATRGAFVAAYGQFLVAVKGLVEASPVSVFPSRVIFSSALPRVVQINSCLGAGAVSFRLDVGLPTRGCVESAR